MKPTVMIFCAHPDDEIIGAGGTIAKYHKEGRRVVTVIFSYGEKSHPWMKEQVTVDMRIKESEEAAKVVGASETIFLGLKDTSLWWEVRKKEVFERVKSLIEKYKPNKIFTHSIDDILYRDHKAVHNLVLKVAKRMDYDGEIYTFSIWNPIMIRKRNMPKLVVDISDTFDLKTKALNCFASQKLALAQLLPGVYSKAIINGEKRGVKFAEVFHKIR